MKRIRLLATGGTINSSPGSGGLAPRTNSENILRYLCSVYPDIVFSYEDVLQMDSSNIQPEQWQIIAKRVYDSLPECDGILITHGTDTMAYTAGALSFMLQGLDKPVVLTGSQMPISHPHTDAHVNLATAVAAVEAEIQGVLVAFNRKIINGARAVKTSTLGFDAFQSINALGMAQIFADGIRIYQKQTASFPIPFRLRPRLSTDVFVLKLIPGTRPEVLDALLQVGYKGIVIEAFGVGGIHYIQRDLLKKLEHLCASGVTVLVCSQCLYEGSNLNIYEVGQRLLSVGVISAMDMTTEAAATKLMWVLGNTETASEAARLLSKNLVGEITPEQSPNKEGTEPADRGSL